jgi:hypothetical protein
LLGIFALNALHLRIHDGANAFASGKKVLYYTHFSFHVGVGYPSAILVFKTKRTHLMASAYSQHFRIDHLLLNIDRVDNGKWLGFALVT